MAPSRAVTVICASWKPEVETFKKQNTIYLFWYHVIAVKNNKQTKANVLASPE